VSNPRFSGAKKPPEGGLLTLVMTPIKSFVKKAYEFFLGNISPSRNTSGMKAFHQFAFRHLTFVNEMGFNVARRGTGIGSNLLTIFIAKPVPEKFKVKIAHISLLNLACHGK
jgi:hypothetical protein